MDNERLKVGIETFKKLANPDMKEETVDWVRAFHPEFADLIVEQAYGGIWSRPGLDLRQRELITMACLISQGAEFQLEFHLEAALNVRLSPEEIVEAIIQCIPYAGFPRSIGALGVAMKIFEKRGIKLKKRDEELS